MSDDQKVCAFLLDIEGTTTPITFVKNVLFPYAKENLSEFLRTNWHTELVQDDITLLQKQNEDDIRNGEDVTVIPDVTLAAECDLPQLQDSVIKYVLWQMDRDRKTTSLKQLQGHIWLAGYTNSSLKAPIYDDVMPAIEQWNREGRKVYIYSSGSVEAQKLLFQHTEFGDLLPLLSGYFDTKIGAKTQQESYERIAKDLKLEPCSILFLTDIPAEAKAAKAAGMKSTIVIREGNVPLSEDEAKTFLTVTSLSSVDD